jgi:hypothetical protein
MGRDDYQIDPVFFRHSQNLVMGNSDPDVGRDADIPHAPELHELAADASSRRFERLFRVLIHQFLTDAIIHRA